MKQFEVWANSINLIRLNLSLNHLYGELLHTFEVYEYFRYQYNDIILYKNLAIINGHQVLYHQSS